MESIYRDKAGFSIRYEEVKDFRRESLRKEDYNFLCIDRYQKRGEGKCSISNENKETHEECITETNRF